MLLKIILKYLLPKKQRQKILNNLINSLVGHLGEDEVISRLLRSTEKTYNANESKKYKTAEEEVDHELMDYPKLIPYRVYFLNTVRNLRVKNGLNP